MKTKTLENAKALANHNWGMANELMAGLGQLEHETHVGSVLEHYISGYFPYAMELIDHPKECLDYIRSVSDRQDRLVSALADIIRNKTFERVLFESPITPTDLTRAFDYTNYEYNKLNGFIENHLEIYGLTPTEEITEKLRDATKTDLPDDMTYEGLLLDQVYANIDLTSAGIDTHAIRAARHSLLFQLIERHPEEISRLAFNGLHKDDMLTDMKDAVSSHNQIAKKMIEDVREKLTLGQVAIGIVVEGKAQAAQARVRLN